jgi:hypothetical protein
MPALEILGNECRGVPAVCFTERGMRRVACAGFSFDVAMR